MQGQWCFNITMNHSYEKMQTLKEYILLSLGTLLIAVAVKEYLIPCQIVTGSVSGLALLISEVLPLGNSLIVLILNLSCLLVGVHYLGNKFGVRCVFISVLLPLMMALIPQTEIMLTSSRTLNILIFLSLLTTGQVIMLGHDTTSGGLDTIAEVLARKLHTSTGLMIGVLGAMVSLLTVGVYGLEAAIVGVIVTMTNGAMISGLNTLRQFSITHIHKTARANA